jgi:hypothetical protein
MSRSPRIKEIVANRILLKTPRGKLRVVLDASTDDATLVQLHDGRNPRLVMCVDSDGNPKLVFWNKTGSPAISMGIADEFCGMTLHDSEGKPVCQIAVGDDGIPRIDLLQSVSPTKAKAFWKTPMPKSKQRRATGKKNRTERERNE